jgi:hypothetical protein
MQARGDNLGVQYIIYKAMSVDANPTYIYLRANPVTKAEQLLQLSLTQFLNGLSKKQQAEFTTLNGMTLERIHEEAPPLEATRAYSSRFTIPTTTNDARRIYLRGPHSIVHNSPHPLVGQLDEFYTYTPIPCILSYLLGFNTSFEGCWKYETDETSEVSRVFDTRCGISMLNHLIMSRGLEPTFAVDASLWSDDMDPHKNKLNKQSVWILTITLASKHNKWHASTNTYRISISTTTEVPNHAHVQLRDRRLAPHHNAWITRLTQEVNEAVVSASILLDGNIEGHNPNPNKGTAK